MSGFYVPTAHNEQCLARVFNGAGEILQPGFYWFSKETLTDIKAGLTKRIYDANTGNEFA